MCEHDDMNYDGLPYEDRDAADEAHDEARRAIVFGLPARPGTRR